MIEVNLRKGSKIGDYVVENKKSSETSTLLLYTRRTSSHFFPNCVLNNLLFHSKFKYSKVGISLSNNVLFCYSKDFLGVFDANSNKKGSYLFRIAYWRYPDYIYKKWHKKVKKNLKTFNFTNIWVILRKLSTVKTAFF